MASPCRAAGTSRSRASRPCQQPRSVPGLRAGEQDGSNYFQLPCAWNRKGKASAAHGPGTRGCQALLRGGPQLWKPEASGGRAPGRACAVVLTAARAGRGTGSRRICTEPGRSPRSRPARSSSRSCSRCGRTSFWGDRGTSEAGGGVNPGVPHFTEAPPGPWHHHPPFPSPVTGRLLPALPPCPAQPRPAVQSPPRKRLVLAAGARALVAQGRGGPAEPRAQGQQRQQAPAPGCTGVSAQPHPRRRREGPGRAGRRVPRRRAESRSLVAAAPGRLAPPRRARRHELPR